uniref:NRT1/PTR family protein 2.1 n=1 Tax=Catharanthus roseus TaxID=4058 RepID=A0A1C8DSE2_CATRO|nr:NRT1/PTR family protein 2.1 [Catharanthus roseus]
MELEENKMKKQLSSTWFLCCSKCLPVNSSSSSSKVSSPNSYQNNGYNHDDEEKLQQQDGYVSSGKQIRKPAGWKAMPYVLGNETFERLASMGLFANFMIFLMTQFHMDLVSASNVINIWSGCSSFLPLLGAFVCDAYAGRFLTLAVTTVVQSLGMMILTLIPWLRELHPPPCDYFLQPETCKGPKSSQMGVLILALTFLAIGSAGIRPCNIPFGADQFDATTEEGRKGINSYYNWYYTTYTFVMIIASTVVVYMQEHVSWVLGFGIPGILMIFATILFFVGTKLYIYVKPEGSVFSDIAQVFVAAKKKCKFELPNAEDGDDVDEFFYNPSPKGRVIKKYKLSNQFRCLNKGALITEGDLNPDGSRAEKWRLSSVQRVEEVKCILRIIPIWAAGIICYTALGQQWTFTISQALKMDRHLGPHFQVPAASLTVISLITTGIVVPIYDTILVPSLRKKTKVEGGITHLQRTGIGFIFSILTMVVAGLVERKRRASALDHGSPDGIAPISVFWLTPQLILAGICDAFNSLGQIEFYNKEFPESMTTVANSLFSVTIAGASYLSLIIVNIIHHTTGSNGHPDWLTADINQGRLENFYFVLAVLGALNYIYFFLVARGYKYKSKIRVDEDDTLYNVELDDLKH